MRYKRTISKLSMDVLAPTVDQSADAPRACMSSARLNSREAEPARDLYRSCNGVRGVSITELTRIIQAEAVCLAANIQSARVPITGNKTRECVIAEDLHRNRAVHRTSSPTIPDANGGQGARGESSERYVDKLQCPLTYCLGGQEITGTSSSPE